MARSGEGCLILTIFPAAQVFMTLVIFRSMVSPRIAWGTKTTAPSRRTMPKPSLE